MSEIGVIIRTYDRDADKLEALAKQMNNQGFFVVAGYDLVEKLPKPAAIRACDFFFCGGPWRGKQWGDIHHIREGLKVLAGHNIPFAFAINGDAEFNKPENIIVLIDKLDEADVLTTHWHKIAGNILLFGRTEKLLEAYRIIPDKGRPQHEKKMTTAFQEVGIKYVIHPCRKENKGIWDLVGYSRSSENYPPG